MWEPIQGGEGTIREDVLAAVRIAVKVLRILPRARDRAGQQGDYGAEQPLPLVPGRAAGRVS